MQTVLVKPPIKVIQPEGRINASNAPEFEYQLTAAVLSPENDCLLVDLGKVDFLDSAGLMILVSGFNLSKRLNRRFTLCSVLPSVMMIFELTQLDRVFEIFENRNSFELAISVAMDFVAEVTDLKS
ncbi:STAS domain-containing protein [Kamptonema sp. UHCC 0994]|uniref:STAS domain-containing protein n=1 Tax=Kamptonema sp. UHCC 0994 TaxID=3031329 RepID=UPI0023B99CD8|nr:STAS domain-containing protein [Kamptonema sp. UHCC 0994]MDF0553956.1 STAS domain-containing protein [Kamptonema sp. UHCC 0994]